MENDFSKEYVCKVPRNLDRPDGINVGRHFISWKQVGYLAIGGATVYFAFQAGMPFATKIALSIVTSGVSLAASFIKPQGVELDEIALNSLMYAQRKFYYNRLKREGVLVVTIKSKEEKVGSPANKTFTLRTA